MKLAIIGSRGFEDYETFLHKLLWMTLDITEVVSGGAKGVDTLAERYAKEFELPLKVFRPEYHKYPDNPKYAPIARNYQIVDYADKVVAFWDGKSKGTQSVITYAESKGKDIRVIQIN